MPTESVMIISLSVCMLQLVNSLKNFLSFILKSITKIFDTFQIWLKSETKTSTLHGYLHDFLRSQFTGPKIPSQPRYCMQESSVMTSSPYQTSTRNPGHAYDTDSRKLWLHRYHLQRSNYAERIKIMVWVHFLICWISTHLMFHRLAWIR